MGVLKSNLFNGRGSRDLEACAADHAFNFFQGKPGNAGREVAINKIRVALLRLGFSTADDGPGEYGRATMRAVLAYKGPPRMILGFGQKTPDAVVGRQTIVRLDKDIVDGGLDDDKPDDEPTPLEFGSTSWRFSFFGNTSNEVFTFFVSSAEGQDSQQFVINNRVINDSDLGAFRGSSSGPFTTGKKLLAKDFSGSICKILLRKELGFGVGSGLLSGSMQLSIPGGHTASLTIPPFVDENLSADLRSGLWEMTTGQLQKESRSATPVLGENSGPALSPSASTVSPRSSTGIRALRRHTFLQLG